MEFRYKKDYLKQFDRLSSHEKERVVSSDKLIRDYYVSRVAPYGLRIKKLYQAGKNKIFEARTSDKIRILWLEAENLITFTNLGNHNEIRDYLKHIR